MITFLLPFKGLAGAKSRWELEERQRQELLLELLNHNLSTVAKVVGPSSTVLVCPDPTVFERFPSYARWLCPGRGLNTDLEAARQALLAGGKLAVLLPDLPELTVEDVEAMVESSGQAQVTLCPDSSRVGTNGLFLAEKVAMPFLFEGASFQRHVARANQMGLSIAVLERPGLARDADLASDLLRSLTP